GAVRVSGVVPQGFCDVGVAVEAEQTDGGVAQGGHDLGTAFDTDLGVVFAVGNVTYPVQLVLDRPVPAQPASYLFGGGVGELQRGERVDDLGVFAFGFAVGGCAGQLQDLYRVRKADAGSDFAGFQGPFGGAAVAVFGAAVTDRDLFPGKGFELFM